MAYLQPVKPHESCCLRQLWLRKEHVRTSPCLARGLGSPRLGLDRLGAWQDWYAAPRVRLSQLLFLNPGKDACLANNLRRPWEPHKYASLELQNTMLSQLQEWVAGYYQRNDAWSYRAHREILDTFAGPKLEHREMGAYAA